VSATTPTRRPSARERLLAAADELFYAEGVRSVGIDRIIEHAGVAKASLYNTFGSKDELVRAYLTARHVRRRERIGRAVEGAATPRDKMLAVFDALDAAIADPSFRGCAFAKASAEIDHAGVVTAVVEEQRIWVHELFTGLARGAGAADPDGLAEQLVLLYDGATTSAQMDRNLHAARAAKQVAAALVDAATTSRST
jgi:AcrR family transcriptional regulator